MKMRGSAEDTPPSGLALEVFDPAPVAVAAFRGPDLLLAYRNGAHQKIFGSAPLGQPLREACPDLVEQGYLPTFEEVFRTGESVHLSAAPVVLHPPRGGTENRFVYFSLSAISMADGDRGVLAVALDVTAQVTFADRANVLSEERRRALQRYQSLVETATQIVWVTGVHGRVLEPSPTWERLTGQSWEEARGRGWMNALHREDRAPLAQAWSHAQETDPEMFEHVYRIRTVDGSYRHFNIRAVPVRENGRVVEWVGTCSDAEEQWQRERSKDLIARAVSAISAASAASVTTAASATTERMRPEDAFAVLSRLIVPELADECGIYLLPEPGGQPDDVPLVAHRVAATAREGLPPGLPPRGEEHIPADSAFARAIHERRTVHTTFPAGAPPVQFAPPGTLPWLTAAGAHSAVLVPVLVDGTVAAMVAAFTCGERDAIAPADVAVIREVLEQAHDPLHNALEFQRTHRVALALQHSLLTEPPHVDGLHIAARYLPSPAAAEVGGDWYDSFTLPEGATALIIGDVVGHDLDAAVTMSKMRNMLRSLAADRHDPPGGILRRLDNATQMLTFEEFTATCVYARLEAADESGWQLNFSNAGHPPPLLVTEDGRTSFLEEPHDVLLGLQPDQPRTSGVEPLPPGSTLLLYTDGLVERPDEDIDEGLTRLRDLAGTLAHAPLDEFCDGLVTPLAATGSDDIALIAVRLLPDVARNRPCPPA